MATRDRRWFLTFLAGVGAVSSGCDLASMMWLVMPEAREEARIKHLASKDPKKVPQVAILTHNAALETRVEFIHADRALAEMLSEHLRARAADDRENLTIIPQRKVEAFKNNHPDWAQKGLVQAGRALGADYVIYLEIESLSLYEKGSLREMLHGRAEISVSLADVNNRDEPVSTQPFSCSWPNESHGPVPVLDRSVMEFRQDFLRHVAKQLSWRFARYHKREQQFDGGPGMF
jgi:hypothetical protein